jgi:hypothetical protein
MELNFDSKKELTLQNLAKKMTSEFSTVDIRFNGVKNKFNSVEDKVEELDFKISYLAGIISKLDLEKNSSTNSNTRDQESKDLHNS